MGELLAFNLSKALRRVLREPRAVSAEIVLFPGVRYERMAEPLQPLKPASRRTPRRRDKTKKEKAS
jgi:hypothetical protein